VLVFVLVLSQILGMISAFIVKPIRRLTRAGSAEAQVRRTRGVPSFLRVRGCFTASHLCVTCGSTFTATTGQAVPSTRVWCGYSLFFASCGRFRHPHLRWTHSIVGSTCCCGTWGEISGRQGRRSPAVCGSQAGFGDVGYNHDAVATMGIVVGLSRVHVGIQ